MPKRTTDLDTLLDQAPLTKHCKIEMPKDIDWNFNFEHLRIEFIVPTEFGFNTICFPFELVSKLIEIMRIQTLNLNLYSHEFVGTFKDYVYYSSTSQTILSNYYVLTCERGGIEHVFFKNDDVMTLLCQLESTFYN